MNEAPTHAFAEGCRRADHDITVASAPVSMGATYRMRAGAMDPAAVVVRLRSVRDVAQWTQLFDAPPPPPVPTGALVAVAANAYVQTMQARGATAPVMRRALFDRVLRGTLIDPAFYAQISGAVIDAEVAHNVFATVVAYNDAVAAGAVVPTALAHGLRFHARKRPSHVAAFRYRGALPIPVNAAALSQWLYWAVAGEDMSALADALLQRVEDDMGAIGDTARVPGGITIVRRYSQHADLEVLDYVARLEAVARAPALGVDRY